MEPSLDSLSRPLSNLRLSVTDRCNLRCSYCMPEEQYTWLPSPDVLSFEEISTVVDAFTLLGVNRVRITGGEPLLRRQLDRLLALLSKKPALTDLALTTNGLLLEEHVGALERAGLRRITISLDTLRSERFEALTRRPGLDQVLAGITAASRTKLGPLKIDTVLMRGTNDDELIDLVEFGKRVPAEVRFIEYMDVGGATRWSLDQVVTRAEIIARLARHYGSCTPVGETSTAPAERFELGEGTTVGIIASVTAPFCASCDRSRLTADGRWFTCLYAASGLDLKGPLREGASASQLASLLAGTWRQRDDRGAEQRLALRASRDRLFAAEQLRQNPHLEMHTRGG